MQNKKEKSFKNLIFLSIFLGKKKIYTEKTLINWFLIIR